MIEKQLPVIKFDIDRKDDEANVIHNEILDHQDEKLI